jgi:2-keto-myo-inositol isomerase
LTLKVKPCLNQDTLRTTPTELFLRIAKKTGFNAIELTMDKVEPIIQGNAVTKLRKDVADLGLTVASINGPENFNLRSGEDFSILLDRTSKLADAAREIGCNLLVPVPSSTNTSASKDSVSSQTAQALTRLAETCGEDLNLGLEFLGMRECSINDLKTASEVINKVAKRNVGLVVDSFHMHLSKTDSYEIRKLARDRILLVHVNDSEPGDVWNLSDANRVYPGEGVIDLQRFRTSLEWIGYDGHLSLELLKPSYWEHNPEEVARTGRKSLERVFGI